MEDELALELKDNLNKMQKKLDLLLELIQFNQLNPRCLDCPLFKNEING